MQVLNKRKLDKDFKQEIKNQVENQIIKLRDTRGNFSLGIKLPTSDYRPRKSVAKSKHKKDKIATELLTKQEKLRAWGREYSRKWRATHLKEHAAYQRLWSRNNPDKIRAIMKRHYDKVRNQEGYSIHKSGSRS